jgi:hypothetical protein
MRKRRRQTTGKLTGRVSAESCQDAQAAEVEAKLKAIRRAVEYSFPTGDIKQILGEIDRGAMEPGIRE